MEAGLAQRHTTTMERVASGAAGACSRPRQSEPRQLASRRWCGRKCGMERLPRPYSYRRSRSRWKRACCVCLAESRSSAGRERRVRVEQEVFSLHGDGVRPRRRSQAFNYCGSGRELQRPYSTHWNPVLHEAVGGGHTQLVNDLVLAGSDLDSLGECGCLPLHLAAIRGLDRVVSTLLLREACSDALGNGGVTPQIYTCGSGHLSVVNTLLTAGADVTICDVDRHSALDNAVCNGHVDVIGALLRHGADVNACDDVGCTPLHHAAEDQAGAIDALIQAGANIESSEGGLLTPLFFATANCSLKAVHTLLRHGIFLTAQDKEGTTPLHRACYRQDIGVEATVDLLLQWGANETAVHNDGNTPADWLVEHNNENGTTCSTAEIGRVRLLLARAPANRAWRRRCWLVMLRSCAKTARATTDKTGDADEGSNDVGDRKDGKCKGARRENGESAGGGVRSRMNGAGEVGVEGGASGLASIVASVVGLGPEVVFRSILSFL